MAELEPKRKEFMPVKWNLRRLRADCEQRIGRPLTYRNIVESTGVSKTTLTNIFNNQSKRVDFEIVDKLIVYFSEHAGRQLDVADLLYYEPDRKAAP